MIYDINFNEYDYLLENVFFDCVGKFVVIVDVIGEWYIVCCMILFDGKILEELKFLFFIWGCFMFVYWCLIFLGINFVCVVKSELLWVVLLVVKIDFCLWDFDIFC